MPAIGTLTVSSTVYLSQPQDRTVYGFIRRSKPVLSLCDVERGRSAGSHTSGRLDVLHAVLVEGLGSMLLFLHLG